MPDVVLRAENVSKRYNVNAGTGSLWAVEGATFELERGDTLGIIGENGSGKSTLLKMLNGIIKPTEGRIEIKGNVASILEIGTGFHPELSGRENIFFNGALLGISKKKLKERFEQIVAFSGINDKIDMPVKHYSSGMYLRLAVSIAFHIDADILLLDEILSVGDAEFRLNTLKRMESTAQQDRTTILVSHNMNEILRLCNKCITLENGKIVNFGTPAQNIAKYQDKAVQKSFLFSRLEDTAHRPEENGTSWAWKDVKTAPGNDLIRIKKVSIKAKGKSPAEKIYTNDELIVEVDYWKLNTGMSIELMMVFYDQLQYPIFVTAVIWNKNEAKQYNLYSDETGVFRFTCQVPGDFLNKGNYSIELTFGKDTSALQSEELQMPKDHFPFEIQPNPATTTSRVLEQLPIVVRPYTYWLHERVTE